MELIQWIASTERVLTILLIAIVILGGRFFATSVWPVLSKLLDDWIKLQQRKIDLTHERETKRIELEAEQAKQLANNLNALTNSFTALSTEVKSGNSLQRVIIQSLMYLLRPEDAEKIMKSNGD